jgi:DNA-damage-inducible protein D
MKILPAEFDGQSIRRVYDEAAEVWWFSVVDVVQVLTQQADYQTARKYWNKLKERLSKEGSQSVTDCHRLKLPAADGKNYLTDVASAETLLRLVQSVPSPKAEPIKLWLAKVGYERMQELADPALSLNRARATWQQHGRSDKWIAQRMTGQETRNNDLLLERARHQGGPRICHSHQYHPPGVERRERERAQNGQRPD